MTGRLVFLVAALGVLGGTAFAAGLQGQITYLEGQATIDNAPASIGDLVPLGATITTDKLSRCEIIFRERNVVSLGEETTFVFNPFNLE